MSADPALAAIVAEQARQAALLADLAVEVQKLRSEKSGNYRPKPSIHWWAHLSEEEVKAELNALRGWWQTVAQPVLGAPELPKCWVQHGNIRTTIETARELWAYLWLSERRTAGIVSAQAEWLVRVWPGLLDVIERTSKNCTHGFAPLRPVTGGSRG